MNEDTLLDAGDEPAHLLGHGPVPGPLAREWLTNPAAKVFLRRLFTRPSDGALVAMESKRRLFPTGMARFVMVRDGVCRTPGCGAPIRHLDHVVPAAEGGPTAVINSQGLCERCNHARQALGWRSIVTDDGVETTTPAGWTCTSPVPPPVVTTESDPADDLPPPRPEPDDWDDWDPPPYRDPLPDPPAWFVDHVPDLTLTA